MTLFRTHSQFSFSVRQRHLLLVVTDRVHLSLQSQSQQAVREQSECWTPLPPLEQLQQELAKFRYNLEEEQYAKLSLSTPLLILLLFELMQSWGPEVGPVPTQETEQQELFGLYYMLSFPFTYHFAMQEYQTFLHPFRSPAVQARFAKDKRQYINTAGMDVIAVFTALYNAGKGSLQEEVLDITEEQGAHLLMAWPGTELKFVQDRYLYLSRRDLERGYIDVTCYDEEHGAGTAQQAVAHLPRN
ncbi:hypothetical protein MTX78_19745 [Hymenobacter tibetensis]|uniref:Uncharacterized protein n=1 Tax=Hymenobacter tibetensis TaxID=497967 RepID=A0ABY4CVY1_9BACT|nr:hypothetical protein [Hymenobacter tibetensis]UOG74338.1 hypothetical protein MTX78_19745 [Hymenobacter tibetensis]